MIKVTIFSGFNMLLQRNINEFLENKKYINSLVTQDNRILIFYEELIGTSIKPINITQDVETNNKKHRGNN